MAFVGIVVAGVVIGWLIRAVAEAAMKRLFKVLNFNMPEARFAERALCSLRWILMGTGYSGAKYREHAFSRELFNVCGRSLLTGFFQGVIERSLIVVMISCGTLESVGWLLVGKGFLYGPLTAGDAGPQRTKVMASTNANVYTPIPEFHRRVLIGELYLVGTFASFLLATLIGLLAFPLSA